MKKKLFILLLFLTSCGYQPIYLNKEIKDLEFKRIIFEGNNNINNKIIKSLRIKKSDSSDDELFISSFGKIEVTSKNERGEYTTLKKIISVNLTINDLNGKIIQKRDFTREFSYNNKENNFQLVEYQNIIENNLINEIVNEILIFLNSL